MSASDRRDDDLDERLDELENVLSELRRDLRETERDRRGPPRPPRLSELVRFTEQYTIPTVIALLETAIRSLELLRGTLRLADPGRSVSEGSAETSDRLADVRDGATAGLSRSLSELRTALSKADLPEDAASGSIVADARDLTAEIESRIEETRRGADAERSRRDGRNDGDGPRTGAGDAGADGPVRIDVTAPDGSDETGDDSADGAPEVDVESELESIKRRMNEDAADGGDGADDADGAGDAGDADDSDPGGANGADDGPDGR